MRLDEDDHFALEERLRSSRPSPDERFVSELEERLLPHRSHRVGRPVLAGAAVTAGLAAAALVLGLAGGGPLAPSGDQGARAKDDCRFVPVRKHVRTPVVVTGRDGRSEIRYRSEVVTRQVKRCG